MQRIKTWTLWYSLGKKKTFLARPFNYCRDFNWKVLFFWNQTATIHFCILQSSRCILDYHVMGSGALPFTVVPIDYNDYRYSVFGSVSIDATSRLRNLSRLFLVKSALFNQAPLFLRWGNKYPIHGEPVSHPFPSPHLSDEGSGPFFSWLCILDTVCLSRLRKLPQIHLFLTMNFERILLVPNLETHQKDIVFTDNFIYHISEGRFLLFLDFRWQQFPCSFGAIASQSFYPSGVANLTNWNLFGSKRWWKITISDRVRRYYFQCRIVKGKQSTCNMMIA